MSQKSLQLNSNNRKYI